MTSLVNSKIAALSILIFVCLLSGCSDKKEKVNTLAVTIEPQKYFLEQIVKDKFEITCLVPGGSNPESFDPAPSQMIALNNSLAYFKIGFLGVENTLIERAKDQANLNIIDCSKGIKIIEEDHHHDHDGDHHHAHAGGDPHYWSSVSSAHVILKNMFDAVVLLDPENKDFYTNNYNIEVSKILATGTAIESFLSQSDTKTFIIYHPALSYFAQEYNLEQLSIEHEGKNPSPAQLKNLIDEAKEKKVKAVFIQKEFDVKNAETVAKEISGDIYTINPLSYNWHEEMINIARAIAGRNE